MDGLRAYLLSVTAAALICGTVMRLLDKKGTAANIGKMVAGIFLALALISPIAKLEAASLLDTVSGYEADAAQAVADGQAESQNALKDIIKSRVEAYILDKASRYGAELSVRVTLSEQTVPVPVAVSIRGSVSPYAKAQLQTILEDDLGIAKEDQTWTSTN